MERRRVTHVVLICAAFVLFVVGVVAYAPSEVSTVTESAVPLEVSATTTTLRTGATLVRADIVRTEAERGRGLSGRPSLAEGEGMLFVFPKAERYGFWMPDMAFAIDIVWLDEGLRVVDVSHNVRPESYPSVFTPSVPARYVLEVPEGFAERHGIVSGLVITVER